MSAFFLTGAVQTGKSTAICRFFCANSALRRGGFLTVSIPTGTGFDVFILWCATEKNTREQIDRLVETVREVAQA